MQIEIILAHADQQEKIELVVNEGTKLIGLLTDSALKTRINAYSTQVTYGVFGQIVGQDYMLQDNDRLEVYRPLIITPTEARARRAKIRAKLMEKEKLKAYQERSEAYRLAKEARLAKEIK